MMSLFWYYRPEHTQGGRSPGVCEVRAPLFPSCLLSLGIWVVSDAFRTRV